MMGLILALTKEMTLVNQRLSVLSHGHEVLTRQWTWWQGQGVVDGGTWMVVLGMTTYMTEEHKLKYYPPYK